MRARWRDVHRIVMLRRETTTQGETAGAGRHFLSSLPAKGPIESQHHGNPLEFKNIYIKELA